MPSQRYELSYDPVGEATKRIAQGLPPNPFMDAIRRGEIEPVTDGEWLAPEPTKTDPALELIQLRFENAHLRRTIKGLTRAVSNLSETIQGALP